MDSVSASPAVRRSPDFDNLGTSFKYQFLTDPSREFVMSASLDVDWGGTGDKAVEASHSRRSRQRFLQAKVSDFFQRN